MRFRDTLKAQHLRPWLGSRHTEPGDSHFFGHVAFEGKKDVKQARFRVQGFPHVLRVAQMLPPKRLRDAEASLDLNPKTRTLNPKTPESVRDGMQADLHGKFLCSFHDRLADSGCCLAGLGFRVQRLGLRAEGDGFGFLGLGFWV